MNDRYFKFTKWKILCQPSYYDFKE
jgi:hypothetical protein